MYSPRFTSHGTVHLCLIFPGVHTAGRQEVVKTWSQLETPTSNRRHHKYGIVVGDNLPSRVSLAQIPAETHQDN
ncbi:hypothetical protein N7468_005652 [Penicillium chermesinum]|uniref:Uncharacterized protein n=1 Tax=Penicillium chermesinum TaxID=63820 RepID=A0A9W9NZL5_9EURO|nr:uncharacterized protein N7468_005652 [Penicillium chermesinum]KAJ5232696.1 hypothetical protein N7468_005652 [Penicillium chermesinum]